VAGVNWTGWSPVLLVVADLVGDAGYYGLGRSGHEPCSNRSGKRLALTAERLRPLERGRDNDWKLLIIRKTQALGHHPLLRARASGCRSCAYMALNLAGPFPKVVLFELVGYFIGEACCIRPLYRLCDRQLFGRSPCCCWPLLADPAHLWKGPGRGHLV